MWFALELPNKMFFIIDIRVPITPFFFWGRLSNYLTTHTSVRGVWLIIISKGEMWGVKSIVIFIATLFTIVVFLSLKNFIGWPSKSKLPKEFQLHWAIIHEPNKLNRNKGYIYMWATQFNENDEKAGIPRAYKTKYTRKNHEQVAAALLRLGDGILQKGEKTEAKEDIDTTEDLSKLQDFVIYDLPKPLLPQKSREGTQAGETKKQKGFNTLEIDPETGRPLNENEGLKE